MDWRRRLPLIVGNGINRSPRRRDYRDVRLTRDQKERCLTWACLARHARRQTLAPMTDVDLASGLTYSAPRDARRKSPYHLARRRTAHIAILCSLKLRALAHLDGPPPRSASITTRYRLGVKSPPV